MMLSYLGKSWLASMNQWWSFPLTASLICWVWFPLTTLSGVFQMSAFCHLDSCRSSWFTFPISWIHYSPGLSTEYIILCYYLDLSCYSAIFPDLICIVIVVLSAWLYTANYDERHKPLLSVRFSHPTNIATNQFQSTVPADQFLPSLSQVFLQKNTKTEGMWLCQKHILYR